jgi:hypothetical protein
MLTVEFMSIITPVLQPEKANNERANRHSGRNTEEYEKIAEIFTLTFNVHVSKKHGKANCAHDNEKYKN